MFISSTFLIFLCSITIIKTDRTIRRLPYKLDGDITALVGDSIISYELTRIDTSGPMSTLEIETEQWVHDCCLIITSQSELRIRLKAENNYPKITAYLRLRTSLSSIVMSGTAMITTTNSIQSDSLLLKVSGASKAQLQVEITSKLNVILSGAAQITMTGNVRGAGCILLSGAGKFDGRACPMNTVIVDVSGAGTAYVIGEQAVDVAVRGAGHVYYQGPLRSQRVSGAGSINGHGSIDGLGSINSLFSSIGEIFNSSTTTMKISINFYIICFFFYVFKFFF
ncbi:unnamed protein product [Adineta steineri]|uniref:Putative auto-transporter adhesin head GIN domain-containing protein n=1 Tax=Adineta steineri TaxID=433720 RepID=A0A814ER93_9BILA|nr:unnamed protein product [Adineta steineri]CAF1301380.1 unnamed protein product [Adineta steineri]CAF1377726.1 unnamed protein product [Adineta steineri]